MTVYWKEWPLKRGKMGGAWYMRRMVGGVLVDKRACHPDNPKQKASTKKEAEYFESIVNQRLCQGEPVFKPRAEPWTFERFVEEKYRLVAEANHRDYKSGARAWLKVLLPAFGEKFVSEISPFEIETFKQNQKNRQKLNGKPGETIKPRTVNICLDILSAIFTMAIGEGLRSTNPCDSVKRLEVEPFADQKRVLSFDAEERLLEALRRRKKVNRHDPRVIEHAIVILVEGGFRPREFFEMKKSQVNLLAHQVKAISYKRGRKWRTSSQPKHRYVPISDRAMPHYQALMELPGEKLYPYASIKKAWHTLCEKVGLEGFWLRWLRDTFKHRCELAGFGPFEIAKLMGHASPQMTMDYTIVENGRALTLIRNAEIFRQKEKRESQGLSQVGELSPNGTTL